MKKVAVGGDNFFDLIRNNCYYVDKTEHIQTIMMMEARVLLLTRPRRFGKTLFMDTLKCFLQADFDHPGDTTQHEKLFSGLSIQKQSDFCHKFMGQFPVLTLSLKDAYGNSFEAACKAFAEILTCQARNFSFLSSSPRLQPEESDLFRRYLSVEHLEDAQTFLGNMVRLLAKHFDRPVVLLIDEYDVPLAKAAQRGYLTPMTTFTTTVMDAVLQNNPSCLKKIVLTGCLPVTQRGLLANVPNIAVSTVVAQDDVLGTVVGFTPSEMTELLSYYGLSSRHNEVAQFYGAYSFAQNPVYCPWDGINFVSKARASGKPETYKPAGFWTDTSGNDVVQDFIRHLSTKDADRLQLLLNGETVSVKLNPELSYADLPPADSSAFWPLLLHTGYLTKTTSSLESNTHCIRFPNKEVRDLFAFSVHHHFSKANPLFSESVKKFVEAASAGDSVAMKSRLKPWADTYVTTENTHSENHLIQGLIRNMLCSNSFLVKGLRDIEKADSGTVDFVFTSGAGSRRIGVVIRVAPASQVEGLADSAKHLYSSYFKSLRCGRQFFYQMSVTGRHCSITDE